LDGGLVGELFPQVLLLHSALYQAYKVIPFSKVSFKALSLSLAHAPCVCVAFSPLIRCSTTNCLCSLQTQIPLNQLSTREQQQQQQEEEQLVVGLDLSCQAAKHGAHSVAH
jgi:hypothetical protein